MQGMAISALWNFNPRSREGSDTFLILTFPLCLISIRAPARGATEEVREIKTGMDISIHAPARGATGLMWAAVQAF